MADYVMHRVYELSWNEANFNQTGQDLNYPSDAEIVASVFCSLLDYSVRNKDEL